MDNELSDMLNSIINSEPDLLVELDSELSPINKENKKTSTRDNSLVTDPLNPRDSNKNSESTSVLDNSLTSRNEELVTPSSIADLSNQPTININLDQLPNIKKETPENIPSNILNTSSSYNTLNKTINNIDNSSTLNVSAITNPTSLTRESVPDPRQIQATSDMVNIINTQSIDIPKIIENVLNNTNQISKLVENKSNNVINNRENTNTISQSENINSTSSINKIEKTADQNYSSESSTSSDSSNNTIVDRNKISLVKPTTTVSNTSSTSSTSENNSLSSNPSNSLATSTISTSDTSINNQMSTYNSNNQTQSAPVVAQEPVNNIVNIDIDQLVQSIRKLEKILISGIDVTIKDI